MSTRDFGSNAKVVVVCAVIICIGIAFFSSCSGAVARGEEDSPTDLSSPSAGKTGEPTDNEPDTGARVTVSAALSDSRPSAGAHSTLSVTVRNAGEGTTAAMTLRYYQSTDATITTADREVATGTVAALAEGGTTTDTVELTAPATPGIYYFGACMDGGTDGSAATSACSVSVQLRVPEPESPDLTMTSPIVSDSGPVTGTQFTLSLTVRNDGEGAASATTLRYYQSTDATITTADREVATGTVATLAATGSASYSVALAAPATPGTYYYGACVAAVVGETDTANNCSRSVQVTVQVTVSQTQGQPPT